MDNMVVADLMRELKNEFKYEEVTKVSLVTISKHFKDLTILVKGFRTSTLVELYLHDDKESRVRYIANIENDVNIVFNITTKIKKCLDLLNLRSK